MAISLIQGQTKTVTLKVTDLEGSPIDITGYETLDWCTKNSNGGHVTKQLLQRTGDTDTTDIIANINNIDDITEGQPIAGPGIPAYTTVLKTPSSTDTPTATGTIKISQAATVTASGVALVMGDLQIVSPSTKGKLQLVLLPEDTNLIPVGTQDSELKMVKSGAEEYVQYLSSIITVAKVCHE